MLVQLKKFKSPICHSLARMKYVGFDNVFGCNWDIIEEIILIMEPVHDGFSMLKDTKFPPHSVVIPMFFEIVNNLAELSDGKIHTEMGNAFIDILGKAVENYRNKISSTAVYVKYKTV